MVRKKKKNVDGRNQALLRLAAKLETLIAEVRQDLRPHQQVPMHWRVGFAGREMGGTITSWRHQEATTAAKLVLEASDRKTELALVLTGILNLVQLHQVDKVDSLVVEYADVFMDVHRDLFGEVVLSGGDE